MLESIDSVKGLCEYSSPQVRELTKAVGEKGFTAAYSISPLRETTFSRDAFFNNSFAQRLRAAFF